MEKTMNEMSKLEIVAVMKECTEKLGHAPSQTELRNATGVMPWHISKAFGTYGRALKECGLKRTGSGYTVDRRTMFVSWAETVRRLGKVPTAYEYKEHSKCHERTLAKWCGTWKRVPNCLLEYMRDQQLEEEWKDVMEVTLKHLEQPLWNDRQSGAIPSAIARPKIVYDQPMYGAPMLNSPLAFAPINEMAVVFLFGAVARQLGFVVTRLQKEFPDCEALRRVDRERWQRILIEFEYESRNFLAHEHNVKGCDMIICWRHNWPECPLEVLELGKLDWNQLMGV
jgi:hypothetical protein